MENIYVINRHGIRENLQISKIEERLTRLTQIKPQINVDIGMIVLKTVQEVPQHPLTTTQIDELTAQICEKMITRGIDYQKMASRLLVNCHHKNTFPTFIEKIRFLNSQTRVIQTPSGPRDRDVVLLSPEFVEFAENNHEEIQSKIDYERDYLLTYAAMKVLKKSYFLKDMQGHPVERWQDVLMRVAIGVHLKSSETDKSQIFALYEAMSQQFCTHATPTIFNAGLINGQLSSCFLMGSSDSLQSIMKTAADAAQISKYAGGIGIHNTWRAAGSYITSTNGHTNGKLPFYEILSSVSRAVDQGGSKRKGSFAIYEHIHDAEIKRFLNLRRISGEDKNRVLFTAVWISDLFMERVKEKDGKWSLFSSDDCPALNHTWGEEYRKLYLQCEQNPNLVREVVNPRELFQLICDMQAESGIPYILYGDNANRFSNQQNLGTIRSSNLCSEIVMYSSDREYGVCNLASICLGRFVQGGRFNYEKFIEIVQLLIRTLNSVIDNNFYPVPEAHYSNMQHRPLGLGVQGLADVFASLGIHFESDEAQILNKKIFETMYYAAVSESNKIARELYRERKKLLKLHGTCVFDGMEVHESDLDKLPFLGAYPTFSGSPLQKGLFRWQLSGLTPSDLLLKYDWDSLRGAVQRYGVRNSLLIALMPTASTSIIMDQIESFEPFKTNFHLRNVKSASYYAYNQYMLADFQKLGILSKDLLDHILANNGSVQKVANLPQSLKNKYKTAYEMDPFKLLQLAIDRQHFIDQSQSFNWFMGDGVNYNVFKKLQFKAWRGGMITGSYYTHQLPVSEALKFTTNLQNLDSFKVSIKGELPAPPETEDDWDGDICLACGS